MEKRLESITQEMEMDIKDFKTIELTAYLTSAGLALAGYIFNNPDLMLSGMAVYQSQTNISRI